MRPIQLGRRRLSDIVWNIIDEKVDVDWGNIQNIVQGQQPLRGEADYNTGSLGEVDAGDLYKVVKFFQPKRVAEVGTFIGVSTHIIYDARRGEVDIWTCDGSNNIDLKLPKHIVQYPKTMSHDMFADLASKEVKVDLVYLDGRLSGQDMEPLGKIIEPHTVFVFDDFEGIEKGVVNALMLESPGRVLVYPRTHNKTAMSIPFTMLQVVAQESV